MSDELKAAAEQIINLGRGYPDAHGDPIFHAAHLLSNAYLAEHRDDDEQPIDGPWLLSVGWENGGTAEWPVYVSPCSDKGGPTIRITYDPLMGCDAWGIDHTGHLLPPFDTRGEVRMACRALGIDLKEPA